MFIIKIFKKLTTVLLYCTYICVYVWIFSHFCSTLYFFYNYYLYNTKILLLKLVTCLVELKLSTLSKIKKLKNRMWVVNLINSLVSGNSFSYTWMAFYFKQKLRINFRSQKILIICFRQTWKSTTFAWFFSI